MSLVPFNYIPEGSEATPGLFNSPLSALSASIAGFNSAAGSGVTFSVLSDVSVGGGVFTAAPSNLSGAVTIHANSNVTDYIAFTDSAFAKSNYLLGSHIGGTADGLNLYDASGATMIVSFSKQSIRFYQNVVGPVFDVGGALANTYNAATFIGSGSTLSGIQAAINQAVTDGVQRVYLPASMFPYSAQSISFSTKIQMVREGGDWTVFDVWAYGANGNGGTGAAQAAQNAAAIISAISAANADPLKTSTPGGVVFFPDGAYAYSGTIVVPMATNSGQVALRGTDMRTATLLPMTSGGTSLILGSPTPDNSGSFTSQTQYGSVEDLGISGSNITGVSCALQLTEMQKGHFRNILIQNFKNTGSVGLYLRGSTGGSAPHSWRGNFTNIVVATTYRPLVLENADENDFMGCNFAPPTGLSSGVTAIHLLQGRNNRFFSLLASGEVSSLTTGRPNYTGFLFDTPPNGDNSGNQVYGFVAEGFDSGVSIASGATNVMLFCFSPSIDRTALTDAGTGTVYISPNDSLTNPLFQWPPGTSIAPSYAFRSEGSLGWYRSATSTMALAPTGRLLVGSGAAFSLKTQPEYGFGGEPQLGILRSAASTIAFYAGNVRMGQFLVAGGLGAMWVEVGSATSPSIGYANEPNLGFYRSGISTIAVSRGTFNLATNAVRLSVRTLAASSVTASAAKTNVAVDEVVFTIGGASGASLIIYSGGTAYGFNSAFSAAAS